MAIARQEPPEYEYVPEIEEMIRRQYPEARFKVTPMPDDDQGIAIWTYSAAESDELRELVQERELELLDKDIYILAIAMPLEAWED